MPDSSARFEDLVEELLVLEGRNIDGGLVPEERHRWLELTQQLLAGSTGPHDKRRFFRVSTVQPARVLARGREEPARVCSLSGGGLCVETGGPAEPGGHLDVLVTMPEKLEVEQRFRTEVRWTRPLPGEDGVCAVGLRFVALDREQRNAVLDLLRERLLRSLEVAQEKYRFFFEHSPDPTVLLDHRGGIAHSNGRALALLAGEGRFPERATFGELVDASSRTALEQAASRARHEGTTTQCEVEVPARDGTPATTLELLVTPVRNGELDLGLLVAGRDVSERVRLEQERRRLERNSQQTEKLATLGRVAAGIAHDINNPLAWVLANLETLHRRTEGSASVRTFEDGERAQLVAECLDGLRRIREIVADLHCLSKLDDRDDQSVDVNKVLEASLRLMGNQLRQRARVVQDLGPMPRALTSFGKLSQVVLNLLANATHAFDLADPERNEVRVRSWHDGASLCVEVADNGRGVPEAIRERVFEPFFTTSPGTGGTGLGLSIAREAAAALGGELTLEPGSCGATFRLRIPYRPAPAPPPPTRPSTPPPGGPKPRLLVVDDEVMLLKAIARQLDPRWEVVTASSGAEALAAIEDGDFDAVLTDVMIPGMTGVAFHAELSRRNADLARRVVFMTGGTFEDAERVAVASLDNPCVSKPFPIDAVEDLILALIEDGSMD